MSHLSNHNTPESKALDQANDNSNIKSETSPSTKKQTSFKTSLPATDFASGVLQGLQNQRTKPKTNTYKLKMALLRLFALVAFIIFYKFVWAQTVSNYQYIESEITKLSEKNTDFDQIKNIFSKSPVYKTKCYSDASKSKTNSDGEKIFSSHLPSTLNGEMSFELAAMDFGFSVFQKVVLDVKGENVESEVQCMTSSDGCVSLKQSLEKGSYPNLAPSDDYFSNVTKKEEWTTYILNSKTLYSELMVTLSVDSKGYFERKGMPISYTQMYLCVSQKSGAFL